MLCFTFRLRKTSNIRKWFLASHRRTPTSSPEFLPTFWRVFSSWRRSGQWTRGSCLDAHHVGKRTQPISIRVEETKQAMGWGKSLSRSSEDCRCSNPTYNIHRILTENPRLPRLERVSRLRPEYWCLCFKCVCSGCLSIRPYSGRYDCCILVLMSDITSADT